MVSWLVRHSYVNNEQIQIGVVVLKNVAYCSSISFVSILKSKWIGHNTYTGRRSNFCSKTTPIHGPVHKYDLNFSYSISHFRQGLAQDVPFFYTPSHLSELQSC